LLLEIGNFPNKHPTQNAAIKFLNLIHFWVKKITFSSRSKFLFKFVGHGFPMNAVLIGIVSLRSFPQLLEEFLITAFPPTPHGDQINKETEIAVRDSEPSANYLQLSTETGRLPQSIVVSDAILL